MQVRVKCSCGEGECPEWAIVELQGVVESQQYIGDRLQNLQIGRICRSSQGNYTFTVGYHELSGTKMTLKKPLLALRKRKVEIGDEMESADSQRTDMEGLSELAEDPIDKEKIEGLSELAEETLSKEESNKEEPSREEQFEEDIKGKMCEKQSREKQTIVTVSQSYSDGANKEHQSGESDSGHVQSKSSDKKRTAGFAQCYRRKKFKQETPSNSISGLPCVDLQDKSSESKTLAIDGSISKEQKRAGSSGKKKRSRWDCHSQDTPQAFDGSEEVVKRRKARWDTDDTQLKMLGPLKLPDFSKALDGGAEHELEIKKLNEQLREINQKLQESENFYDRSEKERFPSPTPVYNELGIRINTREARLCAKLIKKKQKIISKLAEKSLTSTSPGENIPLKLYKKLYIPTKEYPAYNFIGLILGPRGNNQKRMETESGAKILLRGKGSTKEGIKVQKKGKPDPSENEDLHVRIEADNHKSLDKAVQMVEKLLVPLEGQNDLKIAQLRELARLKGTNRNRPCDTCGDANHCTYSCPLTTSASGSKAECQSVNLLGEIGSGIFSTSSVSPNPGQSIIEIDGANVFVGHLPQSVNEAELSRLFCSFGAIVQVKVIRDHSTGLSKGYGFVRYSDPINAAKAVEHMNRFQIADKMLMVQVAARLPFTPRRTGSANAIGHLPTYSGHPVVLQAMPSPTGFSGSPSPTFPGYCAPFPQSGITFAHNGPPIMHPVPYVSPYATPVPVPQTLSTDIVSPMEFANFAGNPDKFSSQFHPRQTKQFSNLFSFAVSGCMVPDTKASPFPGNPDNHTSDHFYITAPGASRSSAIRGSTVSPVEAETKVPCGNRTSEFHFYQVKRSALTPAVSDITPAEAANFPGNPDYVNSRFCL